MGGDRVQDLGWRLQHGLLSPELQPEVIVLLIGTNDLGNGERAEVVLAELGVLVQQLRAARPAATLLVQVLTPCGSDEDWGCSLYHKGLQPLSHRFAAAIT